MLQGIFFDLDDTLIGYAEAEHCALMAGSSLAARVNPAVNAGALEAAIYGAYIWRYAYGTPGFAELATLSVAEFRRRLTEDALHLLGIYDPALTETLVVTYAEAEQKALAAFPDAQKTLKRLRPHFSLGLITNGPSVMQRSKLSALALDGYFDAIIIDTEFGHPKPDVRIFEHAAKQVGLPPHELLFVGNSLEHDIRGACAAGWTSVWMNPTNAAPDAQTPGPHYAISCLSDLLRLPIVSEVLRRPRKV